MASAAGATSITPDNGSSASSSESIASLSKCRDFNLPATPQFKTLLHLLDEVGAGTCIHAKYSRMAANAICKLVSDSANDTKSKSTSETEKAQKLQQVIEVLTKMPLEIILDASTSKTKVPQLTTDTEIQKLHLMVNGLHTEIAKLNGRTDELEKSINNHAKSIVDMASQLSKLEDNALLRYVALRAEEYLQLFEEGLTFRQLIDVDATKCSAELLNLVRYIELEFSLSSTSTQFGPRPSLSSRARCKNVIREMKHSAHSSALVPDDQAGNMKRDDIRTMLTGAELKAFNLLCEMINLTGFQTAQFPFEVRLADGSTSINLRTYADYPIWRHYGQHDELCRPCTLINEHFVVNKLVGWPPL